MDKGWSWVTMMAALGVHFSCGGIQYTTGIIRFILLQNSDPYEARYITWITSMYSGIVYLIGPLTSVLVYKYGCRTTVIVGAFLETLGLFLSFFASAKWIYFISFSFLAGMGSGITYAATLVLLNYNFERCLSMASGIALSGQGSGLIFIPILVNFLFKKYGLQGTLLLLAGVTLHKLIFGALMRPSSVELDQILKFNKSTVAKNGQRSQNSPNSTEIAKEKSLRADKEKKTQVEELSAIQLNETFKSSKENSQKNDKLSSEIRQQNSFDKTIHQKEDYFSDISLDDDEEEESQENNKQLPSMFASELELEVEVKELFAYIISGEDNMAYDSDSADKVNIETKVVEKTVNICRQTEDNGLSSTADEKKNNTNTTNNVEDISPKCCIPKDKIGKHSDYADNTSQEANGNNTHTDAPVKMADNFDKTEHSITEKVCLDQAGSINIKKYNPYLNVLKLRKFVLFLFSIFFFSIPEEIIYMIFPSYSVENGADLSEASYLVSLLGAASCITRFLMGFMANSRIIDSYVLFSIPFGILGLVTLLLPLYVHTFAGRAFYIIIFGFYNCSVYSLLNQIVLRITGLDDSTAAFGLIILVKGTAGVFGPPLADGIAYAAQNSNAIIFFVGSMYVLSMLSIVPLIGKAKR